MTYNDNFQDTIPESTFDLTSANILNWIEQSRDTVDHGKDPNAYEMVNLFTFGAKYISEGLSIDTSTLTRIWDIRSKDFEGCNISSNNFIYAICEDAYKSALSGKPLIDDENSHHALRKMAGLGLFLKTMQRDTNAIDYNNPQELLQLIQCSQSLKQLHPDLFNRYHFRENINVLCNMQLEHQLPDKVTKIITDAKAQLLGEANQNIDFEENSSDEVEYH